MKQSNLPSFPAFWALGLGFCLLAAPTLVFGQAPYQIQGNYNPGTVSQSRSTTLLPQSYQQQQPYQQQVAQPTRIYSPLSSAPRTTTVPRQTVPVYVPAAPSTLPSAYAQQGVYAQPQPYPVAIQQPVFRQEPAPLTYVPIAQPTHTISDKDREQDRRITALEQRKLGNHYIPVPPSGQYTQHVVRRGESLWGIAERYGVSESSIKAANRRSSDMVIEDEILLIPSTSKVAPPVQQASNGTHIVRRGESLSKIAAAYGVSTASLQRANGIANPDFIHEGQPLVIPGSGVSTSRPVVYNKPRTKTKSTSSASTSKPKQSVVYSDVPAAGQGLGSVGSISGPRGVTSYRVEAGDKIENVARTFNSTPSEIQRINKLSGPQLPAPGEEIIVPLPGSVAM